MDKASGEEVNYWTSGDGGGPLCFSRQRREARGSEPWVSEKNYCRLRKQEPQSICGGNIHGVTGRRPALLEQMDKREYGRRSRGPVEVSSHQVLWQGI